MKVFFFSLNILFCLLLFMADCEGWRRTCEALCHQFIYYLHESNVQINGKFLLSGFSVLVAFAVSHFTCLLRHKIKWKSHPDELNSVNIKCARCEKSLKLCCWILRKIDFSCFGSYLASMATTAREDFSRWAPLEQLNFYFDTWDCRFLLITYHQRIILSKNDQKVVKLSRFLFFSPKYKC